MGGALSHLGMCTGAAAVLRSSVRPSRAAVSPPGAAVRPSPSVAAASGATGDASTSLPPTSHAPSAHFSTAELPGSVAHRLLPNTTSPPPPPPVPPLPRPSLVIDAPHRHTIRAGLLHSWLIFRIYFSFGGAFLEIKRNLAKFFLSLFFFYSPQLRAQTRPTPSLPLMVANREGWCLWRRGEFFGQTRR